jgi:single-stranded DNA-binding protein
VTDRPARKDGKTYKDENGYTAKDSEFHRVTCFNGLGQNVAKYCTKGQLVTVEGRIHYTQWEDKDGTKRYGCEIIADKVDFLTKGRARATTKVRRRSTRTEPGAPPRQGPDGSRHRGHFCAWLAKAAARGIEPRAAAGLASLAAAIRFSAFHRSRVPSMHARAGAVARFDRLGAAFDQQLAEFGRASSRRRASSQVPRTLFAQLLECIARTRFGPGHRVSFCWPLVPSAADIASPERM